MTFKTSAIILASIVGCPFSAVAGDVGAQAERSLSQLKDEPIPNLRGADNSRQLASPNFNCHSIGNYKTEFSLGWNTVCYFPDTDTGETFPLLSFAHGRGGGGFLINAYYPMMEQLASSGYVVCAYTQCHQWCPHKWPGPQLDTITTARIIADLDIDIGDRRKLSSLKLGDLTVDMDEDGMDMTLGDSSLTMNNDGLDIDLGPDFDLTMTKEGTDVNVGDLGVNLGVDGIDVDVNDQNLIDIDLDLDFKLPSVEVSIEPLPINGELSTGVFGHSSGGISTLMSAYSGSASEYSIGAAMVYDGAGAKGAVVNADLEEVDPSIPIFLAASTVKDAWGTPPQCEEYTKPTADALVDNPLLVACIKDMDHQDNVVSLLRWKPPLLAVRYIAAFFGHTLDPTSQCVAEYKGILNEQLEMASSHYESTLFET